MLGDLRQLPYAHKMAGVALCTLLQAAWLLRMAGGASSPAARLLLTLPALAANAVIPLLFRRDTEGVTIAFTSFMLTWCADAGRREAAWQRRAILLCARTLCAAAARGTCILDVVASLMGNLQQRACLTCAHPACCRSVQAGQLQSRGAGGGQG